MSAIKEMISQIDISELNIEVSSIEVFKSYLILKVDKNDRLLGIQKKISDELIKQGFNIDRKEFFPHITIVREVKNVKVSTIVDAVLYEKQLKTGILPSEEEI